MSIGESAKSDGEHLVLACTARGERESRVPEGMHTVQVGMDGVIVQGRLPDGICSRQLLDFCYGAKYLFDAEAGYPP